MATTYRNAYATLAEYRAYKEARNAGAMAADTADDAVIEQLLEGASRLMDDLTAGRTFYPRIAARTYDIPGDDVLWLSDDLLEVITLVNGDTTTITSTDYLLKPYNEYPKYMLFLRDVSTAVFVQNSFSSVQSVLTLTGIYGYHADYGNAWKAGSTLNEPGNLNASDLTFTVTSGTPFDAGQVIRIENELMIVSNVATNDITVLKRGDNGSTAATHVNASAVTIWRPMAEIKQACLEIASNADSRRNGQNVSGVSSVSPAGVVTGPGDLTQTARDILSHYRRWV